MSNSAIALVAFIAWALALLIVMEVIRSALVLTGRVAANEFKPDNANLSPFMQRLARAQLNCLEGLPLFGGLLLAALATSHTAITDPMAPWLLIARIVQSTVHLISPSVLAVNFRFAAFAIQLVIGVVWAWKLLAALLQG